MPPREIENSELNLKLRVLEQSDLDDLLRLATDKDVELFVPWAKSAQDKESAQQQINNFQHEFEQGTHVRYGIFSGERMAGYIGVWPAQEPAAYEVGAAVMSEFRGRGVAGQALSLLEKELGSIGAIKLVAHIDESNSASGRAVEKHGFAPTDQFNHANERRYEKHIA